MSSLLTSDKYKLSLRSVRRILQTIILFSTVLYIKQTNKQNLSILLLQGSKMRLTQNEGGNHIIVQNDQTSLPNSKDLPQSGLI